MEKGVDEDPLNRIQQLLEYKSTAKQVTYKRLIHAFETLAKESKRVISELKKRAKPSDADVTLDFKRINEHEFQVKVAGDMVIFVLHTNIVTFEDSHDVMKDAYIQSAEINRYFGQIMIYNFMSDSLQFHRINDPGYLLARLLINHEGRYIIEGEGKLGVVFSHISESPITETDLNILVKLALTLAIENDLTAPPYNQVKFITLHQKIEKTLELGAGQKIGFRMSYQGKLEG
ncbi:MAG: hypothetical protein JNL40_00605 [Cyclobacteriaceae bacterium]|nr:hypothetical protein [Cyclobacteriaceae bacterium]